jgi:hypothetical protein
MSSITVRRKWRGGGFMYHHKILIDDELVAQVRVGGSKELFLSPTTCRSCAH